MWFQGAGMNISNVMGSADTSVVAASKKNKWKLTDSLKDKIAEMAKKDAQNNEYMGNEFKSLRKSEISKVAPDRAALIGKFSYLTGSGNASVMKEVQEADKRWLCMLFGEPYEAKCQGKGFGSAVHVYNEDDFIFPEIEKVQNFVNNHYPYYKEWSKEELYKAIKNNVHKIGMKGYLEEDKNIVVLKLINDTFIEKEVKKEQAHLEESSFLLHGNML